MGRFISFPLLFLAVAVQVSFLPQIRIAGGMPDLVFLMVLSWAVNTNLEDGIVWAFVGGIMKDLLSAAPLGTSTLGLVLVVFAISGLNRQVYRVGIVLLAGMVLGGTVLVYLTTQVVLVAAGFGPGDLLYNLTYVLLPTAAYNLVAMLPVYWILRGIQRRLGGAWLGSE